jgi:glycosyltransferase involved in cell wall biosynthesis
MGRPRFGLCIESLLAQTYTKHLTEIIVVDNGSTDTTPSVVARYSVTLLFEKDVLTSYAARNRGIAHATGEIIAFTDADCVASLDWLVQIIAPLEDQTVGILLGIVNDASPASLTEEFVARVRPYTAPTRRGHVDVADIRVDRKQVRRGSRTCTFRVSPPCASSREGPCRCLRRSRRRIA